MDVLKETSIWMMESLWIWESNREVRLIMQAFTLFFSYTFMEYSSSDNVLYGKATGPVSENIVLQKIIVAFFVLHKA